MNTLKHVSAFFACRKAGIILDLLEWPMTWVMRTIFQTRIDTWAAHTIPSLVIFVMCAGITKCHFGQHQSFYWVWPAGIVVQQNCIYPWQQGRAGGNACHYNAIVCCMCGSACCMYVLHVSDACMFCADCMQPRAQTSLSIWWMLEPVWMWQWGIVVDRTCLQLRSNASSGKVLPLRIGTLLAQSSPVLMTHFRIGLYSTYVSCLRDSGISFGAVNNVLCINTVAVLAGSLVADLMTQTTLTGAWTKLLLTWLQLPLQ